VNYGLYTVYTEVETPYMKNNNKHNKLNKSKEKSSVFAEKPRLSVSLPISITVTTLETLPLVS